MADAPASAPGAAVPAADAGTNPGLETSPKTDGGAPKVEEPLHTIKVNGKEKKITMAEMQRLAQLGDAGQEALRTKAELEKKVQSLEGAISAAKSGDYRALQGAGLSEQEIDAIAVKFLSEKQQARLEEERVKALDPKEKELEDLRKFKDDQDKKVEEEKKAEHGKRVDEAYDFLTKNIIDTLEQFPEQYRRHQLLANRVVDAWTYVLENREELEKKGLKFEELTPQKIAGVVAKNFRGLVRELALHSKDEELDELMAPEFIQRLTKRSAPKASDQQHPELASEPKVREDGKEPAKEGRVTGAQLLRRAYTPSTKREEPAGPRPKSNELLRRASFPRGFR